MTASRPARRQGAPEAHGPTLGAHLWALVGYFILALIVTYPAIVHFTTAVPGDLIADRDQNLWNLWWVREAILRPTNPFHTDMLYYPYGVGLYYHTLGLPQGLIALVPQLLLGLPAAYNTVLLAAFTLGGYGAFRLALLYTGKPLASFLGGLVFAFTPYTLDALKGQLEVLSVQWMPLYAEAWIRTLRNEPGTARRLTTPLLAGLFFTLAALSSLYYAFYLSLFSAGYLVYVGVRDVLRHKLTLITVTVVSLLLLSPFIVGLARNYNNPRLEVPADPAHRLAHSADLLSFFALPHDHPLWGNLGGTPGVIEPPIHDYLSLGYIALALAVLGAVVAWKRRDVPFWVFLGLGALVLALGPELQVGRAQTGIPLPFKLIEGLPGVSAIAKPERFVVLARLCMVVPVVWGAVWLVDRFGANVLRAVSARRGLAFIGLLALLLVELPIHPRYEQPLRIPQLAYALAYEKVGGAVMELPFATQQAGVVGERMVSQTAHGRPIMSGYLSRNYNSPIIDSCSPFWGFISPRDVPVEGQEIASPLVVSHLLDVLNFYDIRYIALYKKYSTGLDFTSLDPKDLSSYADVISRVSHAPPLFSGDDMSLHRVDDMKMEDAVPAFHIGGGWYSPENAGGVPFRWLKGDNGNFRGTLCLFVPRPTKAALVMEGTAFGQDRQVDVLWGTKTLLSTTLPSGGRFVPVRTEPVDWPAGVTEVQITTNSPGVTPQSLDPNIKDNRILTAGFRAVRLETIAQK